MSRAKHYKITHIEKDRAYVVELNPYDKPDPTSYEIREGTQEWKDDQYPTSHPEWTWAAVFKHNYEKHLKLWQDRENNLQTACLMGRVLASEWDDSGEFYYADGINPVITLRIGQTVLGILYNVNSENKVSIMRVVK